MTRTALLPPPLPLRLLPQHYDPSYIPRPVYYRLTADLREMLIEVRDRARDEGTSLTDAMIVEAACRELPDTVEELMVACAEHLRMRRTRTSPWGPTLHQQSYEWAEQVAAVLYDHGLRITPTMLIGVAVERYLRARSARADEQDSSSPSV